MAVLMNPHRRRRTGARRYTALQRAYGFGVRGRRRKRSNGTVIVAATNPSRRRRRSRKAARARRPRRRMSALQRKYFGKRRRHRRARRREVIVAATNPTRRRHHRRRRRTVRVLRVRRNPISSSNVLGSFSDTIVAAFMGMTGALGIDWAWGNLAPSSLQTGMIAPVGRLAASVGLGLLVGAFMGRKMGTEVAIGAATVTLYDVSKTYLQNNVPGLNLSAYVPGLGYLNPAQTVGIYVRRNRMGAYVPRNRMGAYVRGHAAATPRGL
jgi:hypothetical protein